MIWSSFWQEKKHEIHPFLETGNTDILVRILLHGNCLSFLPQYVVRPYLLSGKMQTVDVEDCRIQMWSQLVYHKNKWDYTPDELFYYAHERKNGIK